VALARALAPNPPLLLLDEPLGALDAKLRREMQDELRRLQRATGKTFVLVTHDQEEALTMSDTVVVMNNGVIEQMGSPEELYNCPRTEFVARFIGEMNFFPILVEDLAGLDAQVRWGNASLKAVPVSDAVTREATLIGVRPDKISIHATEADATGENKVAARVEDRVFRGSVQHYSLVNRDHRISVSSTQDQIWAIGGDVWLSWSQANTLLMNASA
jgi:spermidine/putrescine transport system ATP-binding protein